MKLGDNLHVHVLLLVHLLHDLFVLNDTQVSVVSGIEVLFGEAAGVSKRVVVVVGSRLSRTVFVCHVSRSNVGSTVSRLNLLHLLLLDGSSGSRLFSFFKLRL